MVIRLTLATRNVLHTLLDNTGRDMYGLEIANECGLPTGVVYPILLRLQNAGWLTSKWGDEQSGARRRYYSFTTTGEQAIRDRLGLPTPQEMTT